MDFSGGKLFKKDQHQSFWLSVVALLAILKSGVINATLTGPLNISDVVKTATNNSGGHYDAPNVIAQHFVLQIEDVAAAAAAKKRKYSDSLQDQQPGQTVFNYMDVVNLLNTKDNEGGTRANGDSETIKPTSQRKNNAKATDYYKYLPAALQSRSAGKDTHFIGADDKVVWKSKKGNMKSIPLAMKTASFENTSPNLIINQPLHPKQRPSVSFEVNSDNVMFVFEVDKGDYGVSSRYLISVMVEKMKCTINQENEEMTPKLRIQGNEHELLICKNFDSSVNNYQSVEYVTSGDIWVGIRGTGDWTNSNTSAFLTASIYRETSSCNFCEDDHFCCGRKDTACKTTIMTKIKKASKPFSQPLWYRCIPKQDANGQSLVCNGHPECGFHCNQDELPSSCPKDDINDGGVEGNCVGYYCHDLEEDRFLITLLLLILFCVFVPFCIFIFCCHRKDIRRECARTRSSGRCPLPLEIIFCPFSISADNETPTTSSSSSRPPAAQRQNVTIRQERIRNRGNMRQAFRQSDEVNSGGEISSPPGHENPGYLDDLPPPYSECCNDKVIFPNPSNKLTTPITTDEVVDTNTARSTRESPSTSFQLQPIIVVPGGHQSQSIIVASSSSFSTPGQTLSATVQSPHDGLMNSETSQ